MSLTAGMNFKLYQGKAIVRKAYEILDSDEIEYDEANSQAVVQGLMFKCYKEPVAGDFICYLNDEDVYHVEREVFEARNIMKELPTKLTPDMIDSVIVDEEYLYPVLGGTHTICVLLLANGYTVTGESACIDPANFDEDIGKTVARKRAVEKIWMLEGYLLKQMMHISGG